MREILETLEAAGYTFQAGELAEAVGASPESTRRALRKLRTSGRVALLGTYPGGAGVWCLPDSLRFLSRLYGRREGFTLSAEAWKG